MFSKQLHQRCRCLIWCMFIFLAFYLQTVQADDSAQKIACVSGGVGETERSAMLGNQEKYSFWLTVAAKPSGAYLSDVRARISDAATKVTVLECSMDGPWLFANLPSGRYEVEARYREDATRPEQMIKKITTLRQGERRQLMLYFDIPDVMRSEDGPSADVKPMKLKK